MTRHLKVLSLFLALTLLAGCVGTVARLTPDVKTRPVSSAKVIWITPGSLPMAVSRTAYGQYAVAPRINQQAVNVSQSEVSDLLAETRVQMVSQIESALIKGGATMGNDALIRIEVTKTWHTEMGPGAEMIVSVQFSDSPPGTKPWALKIAAGTPIFNDKKTVADRYAKNAVEQLIAAGIIKAKP